MSRKEGRAPLGQLQHAILTVLWDRGAATLAEVKEAIEQDRPIATTTVATVLARLEQSGVVSHTTKGRARVYTATVPKADVERTQVRTLVDRLFAGRAADLIAHLVRETDLDADDLPKLRALLRKKRSS